MDAPENQSQADEDKLDLSSGRELKVIKKAVALKTFDEIPVIAYYFCASWCKHSRAFTPILR